MAAEMEVWPRLMYRYQAAEYMGRCPKTFDKIKHRYAVEIDGLIRYDKVLMDRDIDLSHAA